VSFGAPPHDIGQCGGFGRRSPTVRSNRVVGVRDGVRHRISVWRSRSNPGVVWTDAIGAVRSRSGAWDSICYFKSGSSITRWAAQIA
jgi:hypothetical protein